MKRLLALILVVVFSLSLAACGGGEGDSSNASSEDSTVISFGTKDFQIIRPEESKLQPSTVKIITAVRKATDVTLKSFMDSEPESDKYEILIGNTNRKESQMIFDIINSADNAKGRKTEYGIAFINNKIVINGRTDEAIDAAIEKFVSDYCNTAKIAKNEKFVYGDTSTEYKDLTLNGTPVWKYNFIVPKYNVSYIVTREVERLINMLNEKGNYCIEMKRDDIAPSEYEFIIDNCNREGVTAISNHETYDIKNEGKKVYVNGGRNYATASALQMIIEDFADDEKFDIKNSNGNYFSGGDLMFVWSDEFDTVDTKMWNVFDQEEPWMGGWYDRTNYRSDDEDIIYAENGKIHHIAAFDDDHFYGTFTTTRGRVEFTYGYTEISSKLANGDGNFWHCFWLWDSGLTKGGDLLEFDIMECQEQSNYYLNVIHESRNNELVDNATNINDRHAYVTIDGSYSNDTPYFWQQGRPNMNKDRLMSEQFHTFGLLWDEEKVEFYRDGTLTLHHEYVGKETEDLYRNPHYIILSMATSTNKANRPDDVDPSELGVFGKPDLEADYWTDGSQIWTIDYVQLFQKDGWYNKIK